MVKSNFIAQLSTIRILGFSFCGLGFGIEQLILRIKGLAFRVTVTPCKWLKGFDATAYITKGILFFSGSPFLRIS